MKVCLLFQKYMRDIMDEFRVDYFLKMIPKICKLFPETVKVAFFFFIIVSGDRINLSGYQTVSDKRIIFFQFAVCVFF